ADQAHLQSFQSAPEEYVNADLVDNGACVVTKLTEKRFVQGIPATVAMVDGRRYYFASAFQRKIFELNPTPFLVLRLRNPLAAARLEVPAFAEVLDIDSLNFGTQSGPQAGSPLSPFNKSTRVPNKKKSSKSSDDEDSDTHDEFMHIRAMSGYCPVTIRTQ